MIYCEDCSSYDCGCPERKEIESLRQQLAEREKYVTLLRGALKQARHMVYYGEPQIGCNIPRIDEVIEATEDEFQSDIQAAAGGLSQTQL